MGRNLQRIWLTDNPQLVQSTLLPQLHKAVQMQSAIMQSLFMVEPTVMTASNRDNDPTDEIMCSCSGTRRSLIESLFKQGKDLDAISRHTGALTGCGGCEWEIGQFIQLLSEE